MQRVKVESAESKRSSGKRQQLTVEARTVGSGSCPGDATRFAEAMRQPTSARLDSMHDDDLVRVVADVEARAEAVLYRDTTMSSPRAGCGALQPPSLATPRADQAGQVLISIDSPGALLAAAPAAGAAAE